MKSFGSMKRAAMAEGTLSAKTKEWMALALGVAARCDLCIGYHVQALVKLGASRQELDGTIGVVVYTGGGPAPMFAANAIAAFDEFSVKAPF